MMNKAYKDPHYTTLLNSLLLPHERVKSAPQLSVLGHLPSARNQDPYPHKNNRQDRGFVYFNLYVVRQQTRKRSNLNRQLQEFHAFNPPPANVPLT